MPLEESKNITEAFLRENSTSTNHSEQPMLQKFDASVAQFDPVGEEKKDN